MKLKVKRFNSDLPLPKYVPEDAAGFDLICRTDVDIAPGETKAVPLNLAVEVPRSYVLLLMPRSSTFGKLGLFMPHSVGVVDPYYSGDDNELVAVFHNLSKEIANIKKGDQLVHGLIIKSERAKFIEVKSLGKRTQPAWDSSILKGE